MFCFRADFGFSDCWGVVLIGLLRVIPVVTDGPGK